MDFLRTTTQHRFIAPSRNHTIIGSGAREARAAHFESRRSFHWAEEAQRYLNPPLEKKNGSIICFRNFWQKTRRKAEGLLWALHMPKSSRNPAPN